MFCLVLQSINTKSVSRKQNPMVTICSETINTEQNLISNRTCKKRHFKEKTNTC